MHASLGIANDSFGDVRSYGSADDIFYELPSDDSGITRIPGNLLANKPKAYEPQTVSLGPLHFGHPELDNYEEIKKRFLCHRFPYRVRQFKKLVDSMIDDDEFMSSIWKWYSITDSDYEDEKLGGMMARDGIFLLQLLREISPRSQSERSSSFVEIELFSGEDVSIQENNVTRLFRPLLQPLPVQEDIIKLQNQIPFFVLKKIVQWETETYKEMTQMMLQQKAGKQKDQMLQQKAGKQKDQMLQQKAGKQKAFKEKDKMLQDAIFQARAGINQGFNSILRKAWHSLSPFPDMHDTEDSLVIGGDSSHILQFLYENITGSFQSTDRTQCNGIGMNKRRSVARAVVLDNKGVKFAAHRGQLNKIRFDATNCTLHLPPIEIDDRTDAVLRNLIAFELYFCSRDKTKPIMCYVDLMDQLINTAEDVEVLKNNGIIHNRLGTDQEVANIWNGMRKGLEHQGDYEPIDTALDNVITFYRSYRIWYAEFMKKYFSRPWLVVSLMAACIIIVLSVLQTIFAWEQLHQKI